LIDFEEFNELNRRYPMILFPAFRLQDRMQSHTLGQKKWAAILKVMAREKVYEEYQRTHEGKLPRLGGLTKCFSAVFGGCFLCCKSNITIYAEKTAKLKEKRRASKASIEGTNTAQAGGIG
jgi:hypothetical protein